MNLNVKGIFSTKRTKVHQTLEAPETQMRAAFIALGVLLIGIAAGLVVLALGIPR
jgi:hypothetical protein